MGTESGPKRRFDKVCQPRYRYKDMSELSKTEQSDSTVVLVHLVGGGYVRAAEALQDVAGEFVAEGTRFLTLTDPDDEHPKVVPVERVLYIEEVCSS